MYLITAKNLKLLPSIWAALWPSSHHHFVSTPSSREEMVKEAIEQDTKLIQAVADALFYLPSTEDPDGPIVVLPAPTTKLPRENPIRDITSNPEWERLYQYEIPVLARVREDGTEYAEFEGVDSTNKKTKAALATA